MVHIITAYYSQKDYSQRGFSLLEVLLAMAIICLALAPITQDFAGSLKIGAEGNYMAKNCYLTQAKMEEFLAQDFEALTDPNWANANGSQIMGENFPWQVSISPYDGKSADNTDLIHIYLQVGEVKLETLRFRMQ